MNEHTYAGHTLDEIRKAADAATPGPWTGAGPSFGGDTPKYLNEVVIDRDGDEDDGYEICRPPVGLDEECSDDMEFIATANPATVLALVERIEALEAQRDELLAALFAIANAERLSVPPNPAVMMEHARFAIASAKGGAA